MKTLIILIILLSSCTPFRWVEDPVKMHYAITVYDQRNVVIGNLLCENYKISNDTLYTFYTGYYPKQRRQRTVADMVFPPYWRYIITKIEPYEMAKKK